MILIKSFFSFLKNKIFNKDYEKMRMDRYIRLPFDCYIYLSRLCIGIKIFGFRILVHWLYTLSVTVDIFFLKYTLKFSLSFNKYGNWIHYKDDIYFNGFRHNEDMQGYLRLKDKLDFLFGNDIFNLLFFIKSFSSCGRISYLNNKIKYLLYLRHGKHSNLSSIKRQFLYIFKRLRKCRFNIKYGLCLCFYKKTISTSHEYGGYGKYYDKQIYKYEFLR